MRICGYGGNGFGVFCYIALLAAFLIIIDIALMLVLPAKVEYSIWVTHGAKTLGVRIPNHEISRKLAKLSGGVIVSTSANKSGEEPPSSVSMVANNIVNEVDLVLDGGPSGGLKPSTVLDLSGDHLWILRQGPITSDQIKKVLFA